MTTEVIETMSAPFTLTSPDIAPGQRIDEAQVFNGFGASGRNISPALSWQNPPDGTRGYALMVYDPDAPTGSGWWHWVVYDIPGNVTSLARGAGAVDSKTLPPGAVQGNTDFGFKGYGGPAPPPGHKPHRYYFRLHALGVERLDLPANPTAALVGFNVNGHTLAVAEIMALYSR
jgi:Raf kinase inhibitor-like YbhB/YbcL family protein